MLERIRWLGNSTFLLHGPPRIYINPVSGITDDLEPADIILLSQATYDHCSPAILEKLCTPSTVIIANTQEADCLSGRQAQVLRPWQCFASGRARITAVPSHPTRTAAVYGEATPAVGYLIAMDTYDIFYAGDIVILPDTSFLHPDIAILPVRNVRTGLLAIDHAIEMVKILRPRWVIPSHWQGVSGSSLLDVKAFQAALSPFTEVVVPATVRQSYRAE